MSYQCSFYLKGSFGSSLLLWSSYLIISIYFPVFLFLLWRCSSFSIDNYIFKLRIMWLKENQCLKAVYWYWIAFLHEITFLVGDNSPVCTSGALSTRKTLTYLSKSRGDPLNWSGACYKERLRHLCLYTLEKRRLQGDSIMVFQYAREPARKLERDFSWGCVVLGQGRRP